MLQSSKVIFGPIRWNNLINILFLFKRRKKIFRQHSISGFKRKKSLLRRYPQIEKKSEIIRKTRFIFTRAFCKTGVFQKWYFYIFYNIFIIYFRLQKFPNFIVKKLYCKNIVKNFHCTKKPNFTKRNLRKFHKKKSQKISQKEILQNFTKKEIFQNFILKIN